MHTIPDVRLDLMFGALADPTRRAILARLAQGESTINDLVAPFGLSQPSISKHVKVLERAGLVSRRRNAQFRPVRIEPAALQHVAHWIDSYRELWDDRLDQLESLVKEIK